jgi:hypothetical protein
VVSDHGKSDSITLIIREDYHGHAVLVNEIVVFQELIGKLAQGEVEVRLSF